MRDRRGPRAAVLVLLAALLAAPGEPSPQTGRVVRVIDGDSLEVAIGGSVDDVRLVGIDAPERGQPYADRARAELARLVDGKVVRLEVLPDRDGFGRRLARVFAGEVDVNLALVREGAAWVYRKYSKERALLDAETNARRARRGLWAQRDGEPIPPWEWRRGAKAKPADFTCGAKRTCREMRSCAEARFHLEVCGLTRIDGDGDGVPCSGLCGPGARD